MDIDRGDAGRGGVRERSGYTSENIGKGRGSFTTLLESHIFITLRTGEPLRQAGERSPLAGLNPSVLVHDKAHDHAHSLPYSHRFFR